MKVAALDLGTNSFLCLIAEIEKQGDQVKIKRIISDQVEIVRLGQEVQKNKKFHPEALVRARSCLTRFRKTLEQEKPEIILAMATSAARDVTNAEELFQIGRDLQIPIEIIPGRKEAEITFFGSISGLDIGDQSTAVVDIGGGSTEIIIGNSKKISFSHSADVGAVRISEMFFPQQPPSPEQFKHAQQFIEKTLEIYKRPQVQFQPSSVIAVAGTPTELAKIILGGFDPHKIDGFQLNLKTLEEWQQNFLKTNSKEREEVYHVSPGRSDVILAGVMILIESLKVLDLEALTVSTRGVRYGVALELGYRSL